MTQKNNEASGVLRVNLAFCTILVVIAVDIVTAVATNEIEYLSKMVDIIRSFIHPSIHIRVLFKINRTLCSPCVCVCIFVACACTSSHPSSENVGWNELAHTQIIIELTFIYIAAFILGSLILLQTTQKKNDIWMSCERMPQWASNLLFQTNKKEQRMQTNIEIEKIHVVQGRHTIETHVITLSEFFLVHSDEWICQHRCVCVRACHCQIDRYVYKRKWCEPYLDGKWIDNVLTQYAYRHKHHHHCYHYYHWLLWYADICFISFMAFFICFILAIAEQRTAELDKIEGTPKNQKWKKFMKFKGKFVEVFYYDERSKQFTIPFPLSNYM